MFALYSLIAICFLLQDLEHYDHCWGTHLLSFVPFTRGSHLITV